MLALIYTFVYIGRTCIRGGACRYEAAANEEDIDDKVRDNEGEVRLCGLA